MTFFPDPSTDAEAKNVVADLAARQVPTESVTLHAYAATQIVADGIAKAGKADPKAVAAYLHSGANVQTVLGPVSYDSKSDIKQPGFAMGQGPAITQRRVEANGISLNVAMSGEGPPVLLVHGWPHTWMIWRYVMPILAAAGRRVIAPDLRDLGASERAASGYDLHTGANDLRGLLAALGGEERPACDGIGPRRPAGIHHGDALPGSRAGGFACPRRCSQTCRARRHSLLRVRPGGSAFTPCPDLPRRCWTVAKPATSTGS